MPNAASLRPAPVLPPMATARQRAATAALQARLLPRIPTTAVRQTSDPASHAAVLAERAFLSHLGGGCQMPLGTHTVVASHRLTLRGALVSPDGSRRLEEEVQGRTADGRRIRSVSPVDHARTTSGMSRSSDQSPPPMTFPARAVATATPFALR